MRGNRHRAMVAAKMANLCRGFNTNTDKSVSSVSNKKAAALVAALKADGVEVLLGIDCNGNRGLWLQAEDGTPPVNLRTARARLNEIDRESLCRYLAATDRMIVFGDVSLQ